MFTFTLMLTQFQAHEFTFSDLLILIMSLFISSCLLQKMKNKDCPMIWPVMGIIPTWVFHINDGYHWLTKSLITAGGSFRYQGMWMGRLHGIITADPSSVEYILKTNFKNFPKGKYYRERFFDLLGDGIFNADGATWKEQRRAATAEMHTSSFSEYSFRSMQDLVARKLLEVLKEAVGRPVDLQEILLRFTFDNICVAALGVDPGCLAVEMPEVSFAKAFEEATELTMMRFMTPPFVWKTMKALKLGFEKRLELAVKIVHEFADNIVAERKVALCREDKRDLLTRLVKNEYLDEQGKKVHFTNKILRDFCVSFILAGRDTSSVGLAWFFWLVHLNPKVEHAILEELKEVMSNQTYDSHDVVFTSDELVKKMMYLHAAISESLRLFPPVAVDLKEVIEDDVLPNGTRLDKGSRVIYSIFSMARRESIWGEDCLEFKPERWLKDGKFVNVNSFKYPVFNAGPRLCVGKKFAFLQMKMVAAAILSRYRVKVVEGHAVVPKITTTLYMKHGLMVILEPRPKG
ncbi:cytochrome P450 86B1-like [Impatiens glandulifera]|uniref:cytochrome P450 86B1-like n=1 Tax=Impatiens glandulifera TaxID=253017 RepID=UPI001FB12CB5|nr:cytochrome P450 86B1-like [Impatiens glandulifera]